MCAPVSFSPSVEEVYPSLRHSVVMSLSDVTLCGGFCTYVVGTLVSASSLKLRVLKYSAVERF